MGQMDLEPLTQVCFLRSDLQTDCAFLLLSNKVHTTNRLIMLTIKVKSELNILASERKTAFTVLCLTRVLKTATRACIP